MKVNEDIHEWQRHADMDFDIARHLYKTFRPLPIERICFLSQQAAEKILKYYLVSKSVVPPKTHDIRELTQMCSNLDEGFAVFRYEEITLTRYGVMPRYPNELELEKHDAETAIKYADKIMTFVKGLLVDT